MTARWMCDNRLFTLLVKRIRDGDVQLTVGCIQSICYFNKDLQVLLDLITLAPKVFASHSYNLLDMCVVSGSLEIIKYIREQIGDSVMVPIFGGVSSMAIDLASELGLMDIVRYLSEKGDGCTKEAIDRAAENGSVDIVEYLLDKEADDGKAIDLAARAGHLSIVKMLAEKRCRIVKAFGAVGAASGGHMDIIEWLHENSPQVITNEVMDKAARYGRLEIVQYLNDNGYECSDNALQGSLLAGHLQVTKYLLENRSERGDEEMVYRVVESNPPNLLEIITYLATYPEITLNSDTFDVAASKGNLDVVKFLHQNCTSGCSEEAMTYALIYNHVPVYTFLHENRTEGCAANTMAQLAGNGSSLESIVFLHEKYGIDLSPALQTLCTQSNLLMIKALDKLYPNQSYASATCSTALLDNALSFGMIEAVQWLATNRTEGSTKPDKLAKALAKFAAKLLEQQPQLDEHQHN
eukprot:gene18236-21818_t